MKTYQYLFAAAFMSLMLTIFSCSPYSAANPAIDNTSYARIIERAKKDKRYFIMQSGINVYTITSVDLDKAKKQMTVTLDKVDSLRLSHFKNPGTQPGQQNPQNGSKHEIFLLMKDSTSYTLDEPHTIPVERIARIE